MIAVSPIYIPKVQAKCGFARQIAPNCRIGTDYLISLICSIFFKNYYMIEIANLCSSLVAKV